MFEHPSKYSEALDVGLERPLKSSSSSAAAGNEYKRGCSGSREGAALRLFSSESWSSSDWNHQANLQESLYFPQCKGNYFKLMDCICNGTLQTSHILEKLIQKALLLSFCFSVLQPGYDSLSQEEMKVSSCWLFSQREIQFMEQKNPTGTEVGWTINQFQME